MSTLSPNPRFVKRVYVFNSREILVAEYESLTACASAMGVRRQTVKKAVTEAKSLKRKYYISYKAKFPGKKKAKAVSPLRPQAKAATPKKTAPLSPAKAKAAAKRLNDIALRSRCIHLYMEGGLFGPFSAFH